MRINRTTRSALAAAALVAALAACGGDGTGDATNDDVGVASLRDDSDVGADDDTTDDDGDQATGDAATGEDGELEAPEDPEEAFALFNECLQEHGIDVGEGFVVGDGETAVAIAPQNRSEAGEGPADQIIVGGAGPAGTLPEIDEEFLEANEACSGHLANATRDFELTPEQEAAMEDAQLAFQQCMSEHGIEGGGFSISVGEGPGIAVEGTPEDEPSTPVEIDPEEFAAAAEECQSVYEDYPELDDVLPDGGPGGGVFVSRAENVGGGS